MAMLSEGEKARRAANRRRKAALAAEEDAIRRENKRREWVANGTFLTRAELEAGVPCRGCGLPVIDGLGDDPPLMKMTSQEREVHEAAAADFKRRHPDCPAGRWTMSGSRTQHCGFCCPPPPFSAKQLDTIAAIFAGARRVGPPDPAELDTWRLTLTCDHVIDKTQQSSHTYWSGLTTQCPACGQIRGIITCEKLPPNPIQHAAEHHQLTAELDQALREHERHQKKTDTTRRRIDRLEGQLRELGPHVTLE